MNLIEETHWGITRAKEAARTVFTIPEFEKISEALDRCLEAYSTRLPTSIKDLGDIQFNDGMDSTEENKLLTLEQLRKMNDKPVWLVLEESEYQCKFATWAILQISAKGDIGFSHHGAVNYYGEGHPYKAYAHEPRGSESNG